MMINKITPSVDKINGSNPQHNEPINQSSPKLLNQRIRKCYYKTLGTSVINSPLFPISDFNNRLIFN